MQVAIASEPGSPDKPNEDGVVVTADMAAVLDGATVRTDTGCIHGVPWFVANLAGSLVKNSQLSLGEALRAAITETALAHRDTCDLRHPGTPSAAVTIVQSRADYLNYLVLGDVTLVIDTTDGLRIITDNRVNATAVAEREVADALPNNSPEKADALIRMKRVELASRNRPGGYWVAAADPTVVTEAVTGTIPLKEVSRAALLTDGAARAVTPFKLYGWPDLLSALASDGPGDLIKKIRMAESSDPQAIWHPRNKVHDDATVMIAGF